MILDTNAISGLADGHSSLAKLLEESRRHHLPAIVLGEYRYGLRSSRERRVRELWLDELEAVMEVLEVSSTSARHYADIREELRNQGDPIPENDIWISALAREHQLEVVSRDRHFDKVPRLVRRTW